MQKSSSLRPCLFAGLVVGFLIVSQAAFADTIVFNDLTDTVTVSLPSSSARTFQVNCSGETCLLHVREANIFVFESSLVDANIGDPDGVTISDLFSVLLFSAPGGGGYDLTFTSDSDPGGLGSCPPAGCDYIENGTVQTLGTVTWEDGSVDTIQFQSDVVEAVPEPSSMLLLGSGLAVFAGVICRKQTK